MWWQVQGRLHAPLLEQSMRANHYFGSEGGRWGGRFWPHGINRDIYQPERSVARSRGRQGHGTLQSAGQPSRRCSCSCRRPQRRGAAEERRAAGRARHRTVPARRARTGDSSHRRIKGRRRRKAAAEQQPENYSYAVIRTLRFQVVTGGGPWSCRQQRRRRASRRAGRPAGGLGSGRTGGRAGGRGLGGGRAGGRAGGGGMACLGPQWALRGRSKPDGTGAAAVDAAAMTRPHTCCVIRGGHLA